MPVTLKLSKRFYDTIGPEVANEFVDALNAVDQSYRTEFRELFVAHFGQVRAEMDKLAAELRGDLKQLESHLEVRIGRLEGRMDAFQEQVKGDLKAIKSELISWMVGLWFVTAALGLLTRLWTG